MDVDTFDYPAQELRTESYVLWVSNFEFGPPSVSDHFEPKPEKKKTNRQKLLDEI